MDELVYQRESLRRATQELLGQLDEATEKYDPSEVVPKEDLIGAVLAGSLGIRVKSYGEAITAHAKNLSSIRKEP